MFTLEHPKDGTTLSDVVIRHARAAMREYRINRHQFMATVIRCCRNMHACGKTLGDVMLPEDTEDAREYQRRIDVLCRRFDHLAAGRTAFNINLLPAWLAAMPDKHRQQCLRDIRRALEPPVMTSIDLYGTTAILQEQEKEQP